ncbi:MAG: methylmalonyl-CoA mutase family protein, partial [Saprospiraceae bacterium]|nr:methylmalonyl-CoA mutase family protein [Saprospiraceae bacterium]
LRAFRRLWLALLEAYEYEKAIYPYLAVQTTLSETKDDQYWNMISSTTQAMSAAVAGANSIAIVPSNGVKESDEFTRRIARNVHHLLISESFMNRVVDPSAGSYYIENITQDISVSAWQTFCVLSK